MNKKVFGALTVLLAVAMILAGCSNSITPGNTTGSGGDGGLPPEETSGVLDPGDDESGGGEGEIPGGGDEENPDGDEGEGEDEGDEELDPSTITLNGTYTTLPGIPYGIEGYYSGVSISDNLITLLPDHGSITISEYVFILDGEQLSLDDETPVPWAFIYSDEYEEGHIGFAMVVRGTVYIGIGQLGVDNLKAWAEYNEVNYKAKFFVSGTADTSYEGAHFFGIRE